MRLDYLPTLFARSAGERPDGWDAVWAGILAVIGEPLDAPGMTRDSIRLEISSAFPPYSDYANARLTRSVGFPAPDSASNGFEAQFIVSAKWHAIDVGRLTTLDARGPSTYEHDPAPTLDQFVS